MEKLDEKTGYVYLKIPREEWDVMAETLSMDVESPAFDNKLRQKISEAFNTIEFIKHPNKIAYLNSEASGGLNIKESKKRNPIERVDEYERSIEKAVLNHPEVEIMKIMDFIYAFNQERISDLGYIAMVEDVG